MATEPVPSADEDAVPFCTRVTPLVDTLKFGPVVSEELDEVGEDPAADGLDAEPEGDGWAHATHGVAASPVPMPSATANAPIRPICVAYPVAVYFALLIVIPLAISGRSRWFPGGWSSRGNRRSRSAGNAQ